MFPSFIWHGMILTRIDLYVNTNLQFLCDISAPVSFLINIHLLLPPFLPPNFSRRILDYAGITVLLNQIRLGTRKALLTRNHLCDPFYSQPCCQLLRYNITFFPNLFNPLKSSSCLSVPYRTDIEFTFPSIKSHLILECRSLILFMN